MQYFADAEADKCFGHQHASASCIHDDIEFLRSRYSPLMGVKLVTLRQGKEAVQLKPKSLNEKTSFIINQGPVQGRERAELYAGCRFNRRASFKSD